MPRANIKISGIPVEVEFEVIGPDPSVGIFRSWIEELTILSVNGRKVTLRKHVDWLYTKLHDRKIFDDAVEQCFEDLSTDF